MSGQLETACIDCTRYEPQDGLGHALALLSGTPYLIIFSQALIAYREGELEAWAALAGFVGNAAAGKLLKRLAAQHRPVPRCALLRNCGGFGMPSSHAQTMAFASALHLGYALAARRGPCLPATAVTKAAESALLGVLTLAVCHARVYLGYHSVAQVAVGAVLGAAAGAAWAWVLQALLARGWFEALARSPLGVLRLRSSCGGRVRAENAVRVPPAAPEPGRAKQT